MTAVQVPAELLERTADDYAEMAQIIHENSPYSDQPLTGCKASVCRERVARSAELRALLPQPAATCPRCGHEDGAHATDDGCWGQDCDCRITRFALPQVRALLAAQADAKPVNAAAPGSQESFLAHIAALGEDFDAVRRSVAAEVAQKPGGAR